MASQRIFMAYDELLKVVQELSGLYRDYTNAYQTMFRAVNKLELSDEEKRAIAEQVVLLKNAYEDLDCLLDEKRAGLLQELKIIQKHYRTCDQETGATINAAKVG